MSHKYNKDDDYKRDIRLDSAPPDEMARHRRPSPSRFWLFALSFLPGLSHIYMGLIRRGLFYMLTLAFVIFFASVVVPSFERLGIFIGFSIVAIFAVSFFEAFSIRRDIIMGKEVKDVLPTISILVRNKAFLIVIAVIFAVAIGLNILAGLPWYAWLILGIVAVCYAPYVYGRKKKQPKKDEERKDE